jgi:Family of unknown function (DUF6529)
MAAPAGATAAPVVKKPVYLLVPLLVGAVVSVTLGVFARVHEPVRPTFSGPFSSPLSMKVWLASIALVLALVQLVTALWMYGKLRVRAPGWAGTLHRTTGITAFLVTLPVAFNCLYSWGFSTFDTRGLLHSLLGCTFYGAFVAKVLTLHSKRVPGWALPWVGGLLFTALAGVTLTSAVYWFSTHGAPN